MKDTRTDTSQLYKYFSSNPTECPYYLVTRASLAATSLFKKAFAEEGLTDLKPAYLGTLLSLWKDDGLKIIELGRRAGLEPSTMTGLIDRMEKDGLVSRVPDPEDRRVIRVFLTSEGRDIELSVASVVEKVMAKILSGFEDDEVALLKESLRKMLSNIHQENADE
ncbi:MAG TPA: MarR family transcriptional regulator [Deltaproteobacteria bacterium]|nr:MarR family transcriptional regulator [Deltaproteobacteria bacterium]HOM30389.1 MarR family transcriptional regulator [Deltaproteobacteria bacterium]HPP81139.1 MarR family transcriptional regulator [Deltaproteobacteria bacterium]